MAVDREDRIVGKLFARHAADGETVLLGPGDDAAMVRCPPDEELLITTDTLNEGIHFPAGTPAHAIGYRALAVSLSDLAAMGARPLWALVTLSVPSVDEEWLKKFADGVFSVAEKFGLRVIGGDFARGPLNVTVTAHGAAAPGTVLKRSGASAGDGIWVSGFPGDAAAGLELLEERLERANTLEEMKASRPSLRPEKKDVSARDALVQRFCYPEPRTPLGRALSGIASACMDLSDGLMMDLPRLLRCSEVGAQVAVEDLPVSGELRAVHGPEASYALALTGGDDYELCFTVPAANEHRLKKLSGNPRLTRIGEMHPGEGLKITRQGTAWAPPDSGFRHFS